MGPREQAVRDAFDVEAGAKGFRNVSYQQFSPDGSNLIGEFFFLVCPLCAAMVPVVQDDAPEDFPRDIDHIEFHVGVAQMLDALSPEQA